MSSTTRKSSGFARIAPLPTGPPWANSTIFVRVLRFGVAGSLIDRRLALAACGIEVPLRFEVAQGAGILGIQVLGFDHKVKLLAFANQAQFGACPLFDGVETGLEIGHFR